MVGLWKTDVMGTIEQMSADKRSTYESRPEPVNQVFRESLSNRYYEFKNDGTVIYSFTREGSKRSYQGTWKYNSDTGELVTIHDGTKTTLIVGLLSTDQIILKKDKYDERSMINNLVLLRISD